MVEKEGTSSPSPLPLGESGRLRRNEREALSSYFRTSHPGETGDRPENRLAGFQRAARRGSDLLLGERIRFGSVMVLPHQLGGKSLSAPAPAGS